MKTFAATVFLMVVSFGWMVPSAQACTCIPPDEPLPSLKVSDAVFQGRVTRIFEIPTSYGGKDLAIYFDVNRQWKGVEGGSIVVRTETNSAGCGYPFVRGESYLVYASRYDESSATLHTSICTRTRDVEDAAYDIDQLGEGETIDQGGCGSPFGATVLQTFFWVGMVMLLRRRPTDAG